MKALLIGDIHGRTNWKRIVQNNPDVDQVIIFGDYFDPYDFIPGYEQLRNFNRIVDFAVESKNDVVLLLGNHDLHYYSDVQPCSRYDRNNAKVFTEAIAEALLYMNVAHSFDDVLCSHAGVSPKWLDKWSPGWDVNNIVDHVENIHDTNIKAFGFDDEDTSNYGNNVVQGPMWIRPEALITASKEDTQIKDKYRQVFGHTQLDDIVLSHKSLVKFFDERFIMVDALEHGGYMVYEDGVFTPHKLK